MSMSMTVNLIIACFSCLGGYCFGVFDERKSWLKKQEAERAKGPAEDKAEA